MKPCQDSFGLDGAGSSTIFIIIYNLAPILAFSVVAYIADIWGRKPCIFTGYLIIFVKTATQATAHSLGQFMGGRFILGFSVVVAYGARPAYTVEVAYPAYRDCLL